MTISYRPRPAPRSGRAGGGRDVRARAISFALYVSTLAGCVVACGGTKYVYVTSDAGPGGSAPVIVATAVPCPPEIGYECELFNGETKGATLCVASVPSAGPPDGCEIIQADEVATYPIALCCPYSTSLPDTGMCPELACNTSAAQNEAMEFCAATDFPMAHCEVLPPTPDAGTESGAAFYCTPPSAWMPCAIFSNDFICCVN